MNSTFVANLLHGSLRICVAAAVALSFFSNTLFAETYTYKGAQIEYTGAQVSEVDGDLLLVYKDTSAPHSLILPGYALARILVVGGGGAGGDYDGSAAGAGGGGGAGGYVETPSNILLTPHEYQVVVGKGGSARTSGTYAPGENGGNSWITNVVTSTAVLPAAIGGGGGGFKTVGGNGGSGGGGSAVRITPPTFWRAGGSAFSYEAIGAFGSTQGCSGGMGQTLRNAGGGGGASAEGNSSSAQGFGGGGINCSITGFSILYAKGGDGGYSGRVAVAGDANTGFGGGGASTAGYGAAGGSGIVVIRISWARVSDKIEKPANNQSFVYDGGEHFVAVEVPEVVTLTGDKSAINVGKYTTIATLASGMTWADGSVGSITVNWSITEKEISEPTIKTDLVYNGSPQKPFDGELDLSAYDIIQNSDNSPSVIEATDVGEYKFTLKPNSNHKWAQGAQEEKEFIWSIARKSVPVPTAKSGLIYNGLDQIAENPESPFDYSSYSFMVDSVTNAINAGEYNFTVRLDSNHCWVGGDISNKTITWNIAKAPVALPPENAFINEFYYTGLPLTAMTAPDRKGTRLNSSHAT